MFYIQCKNFKNYEHFKKSQHDDIEKDVTKKYYIGTLKFDYYFLLANLKLYMVCINNLVDFF